MPLKVRDVIKLIENDGWYFATSVQNNLACAVKIFI
jgi:hypothetical protein